MLLLLIQVQNANNAMKPVFNVWGQIKINAQVVLKVNTYWKMYVMNVVQTLKISLLKTIIAMSYVVKAIK